MIGGGAGVGRCIIDLLGGGVLLVRRVASSEAEARGEYETGSGDTGELLHGVNALSQVSG